MTVTERRASFRWQISFPCEICSEGGIEEAFVKDISLGGLCVTGKLERKGFGSQIVWIGDRKTPRHVPAQTIYWNDVESSEYHYGFRFRHRQLRSEELMQVLKNKTIPPDLAHRNLSKYFDDLLAQRPGLLDWASRSATEDILDEFRRLNEGEALQPPEEFVETLKLVVGDDWPIAVFMASRWASSQKETLSDGEVERLTEGLLWGTLLVELVDGRSRSVH